MKIQQFPDNQPHMIDFNQTESKEPVLHKGSNFNDSLHQAEYGNSKNKMDQLARQIFEQGKIVGKHMDIKELLTYKKLVSEFMKEYINSSYKFSKQNILDKKGRYRVYSTIKKINLQLDELTKDILNNEKDNLKILQYLDDIKGLILDLLM